MDLNDIVMRALFFVPVLLSLTVHEWAHAWTAFKLGDDTARLMGRLTLNPIAHMDPIGTFLLPLMGFPFGWAKPVPVDPRRFRRGVSPRRGMLLVAAAGPISNAIIAAVAWSLLRILSLPMFHEVTVLQGPLPFFFLRFLLMANIGLCVFNLFPIPPLDGSKIVDGVLPDDLRPAWNRFCEMGPGLLIALILLPQFTGFSPIGNVIEFLMQLVGEP